MKASKILLGVDFNPASRRALEWATALAHETGAQLIIAVVEPGQPTSNFGSIYRGLPDPGIAELAQQLANFCPPDAGVAFEHRILRGEPSAELLKCAADENVDVIVLGSHGDAGLKHALLGSTAEAVFRGARCCVMICKS